MDILFTMREKILTKRERYIYIFLIHLMYVKFYLISYLNRHVCICVYLFHFFVSLSSFFIIISICFVFKFYVAKRDKRENVPFLSRVLIASPFPGGRPGGAKRTCTRTGQHIDRIIFISVTALIVKRWTDSELPYTEWYINIGFSLSIAHDNSLSPSALESTPLHVVEHGSGRNVGQ